MGLSVPRLVVVAAIGAVPVVFGTAGPSTVVTGSIRTPVIGTGPILLIPAAVRAFGAISPVGTVRTVLAV